MPDNIDVEAPKADKKKPGPKPKPKAPQDLIRAAMKELEGHADYDVQRAVLSLQGALNLLSKSKAKL